MDTEAVLLNVAEMIDLAIGTPELGVVDFCMLQTVLHCLAQQMRILDKNVELRGAAAGLPVGRQLETGETIKINEFIVQPDGATQPSENPETMLVVDRIQKDTGVPKILKRQKKPPKAEPSAAKVAKSKSVVTAKSKAAVPEGELPEGELPEGAEGAEGDEEAKEGVEGGEVVGVVSAASGQRIGALTSSEKLCLVTLSKFNVLETVVQDLKNRVYGSIPKNEEIIEEVRSQTNLKAITEMWTSLNVSSRLEATEQGVAKLSSLVQDLVGQTSQLNMTPQNATKSSTRPSTFGAKSTISTAQPKSVALLAGEESVPSTLTAAGGAAQSMQVPAGITDPSGVLPYSNSVPEAGMDYTTKAEFKDLENYVETLRGIQDHLSDTFYGAMKVLNVKVDPPSQSDERRGGARRAKDSPIGAGGVPSTTGASEMDAASMEKLRILTNRLKDLEDQMQQCVNILHGPHGNLQDQLNALHDHVDHYTKQVASMSAATGSITPELLKDLQGLMGLYETVQNMQTQLNQVYETSTHLASEKEERLHNFNALLEQMELLKAIKLDREDMVEALADKADLRMLARKVSHDQFEMACDDLSSGLEHALDKLNVQESLWQQALDDIQREIEAKLDKVELSPVRDFFNSKLKQLQENLKQIISMRRETEAAGTKKKLLNDVNCISCDAKAFMSMEPGEAMPPKPLKPSMSMKPYLTYELDTIRKTQATSLSNRNMHDWEKIDKQMTATKQPQKVRSDTDKHLCNRYCGGSHTTTTPAQRVARLGHFIKQWGPEVLPLSGKFATGDDGRLYKVCDEEGAKVGPGGAVDAMPPAKAPSPPPSVKKADSKSAVAKTSPFNDCRCLDERLPKN
ncbi:unnamed protein product [Arctia plantaginis]|uniref:DUF4795 domain-containing protein n=1 Tax=Arctia plantaginis TaxID=874455 RepID=A0A8S0ZI26_ARCPL|nr:unnamed protein product [Arctia plantaginis]